MRADLVDTISGLAEGLKPLAADVLGSPASELLCRALSLLASSGIAKPAELNHATTERLRRVTIESGADLAEADRISFALDALRSLALALGHIGAEGALAEVLDSKLDPITKAERIREMHRAKAMSLRSLARSEGIELTRASRLLSLLELPGPIVQLVREEQIPELPAYEIAKRRKDLAPEDLIDLARRYLRGELTTKGLARDRVADQVREGRGRFGQRPVILFRRERTAVVLGIRKKLTQAQILIVAELLKVYPAGLSMADMEGLRESYESKGVRGFAGWWQTLRKLKESDPEWDRVIRFPRGEDENLGYRIIDPRRDIDGPIDAKSEPAIT